jgi:hypothetical protein
MLRRRRGGPVQEARSTLFRLIERVRELPPTGRAAAIAVPLAFLAAVAYAGRRRLWQALGLAAEAIEEVADTIEDAAEDLGEAAEARAAGLEDRG